MFTPKGEVNSINILISVKLKFCCQMSYGKLWFSEFLGPWDCRLEIVHLLYKSFTLSDYFSTPRSTFDVLQQRQEGIFVTVLQMREWRLREVA